MFGTQQILGIIAVTIGRILDNISPQLRGTLFAIFEQLRDKAEETENPWDDVLVSLLYALFGFDNNGNN